MSSISKRAEDKLNFGRRYYPFESARAGMRRFLESILWNPGDSILLPAYIGWSQREGSGVFDPVQALSLNAIFYRLDENLTVDIGDLQRKLSIHKPRVVVIIHYFGFVDKQFPRLIEMCRSAGTIVLEDAAHAMLTDLIGGRCGREGTACLYSLHKMLPCDAGGALVMNQQERPGDLPAFKATAQMGESNGAWSPWAYDLFRIAEARRNNAKMLSRYIHEAELPIDLLHPELENGIVPQTLPIRLRFGNRDQLYDQMNSAGYGVTSLYHTLVSAIPREEFATCFDLSRRIMNLPIHQDIDSADLREMVIAMKIFLLAT